jgi:hypothetical protein
LRFFSFALRNDGVAEIKKATARYGNESLHDPAHLAGNENPQDCHSVHHLQSAKKCTACQRVHWKLGKLGEEKNCMGPFTNDKQ